MDRKSTNCFGGWPGVEHIPYEGDYDVDGKPHLPLEKVAREVAKAQSRSTKRASGSTVSPFVRSSAQLAVHRPPRRRPRIHFANAIATATSGTPRTSTAAKRPAGRRCTTS